MPPKKPKAEAKDAGTAAKTEGDKHLELKDKELKEVKSNGKGKAAAAAMCSAVARMEIQRVQCCVRLARQEANSATRSA